MVSNIEFYTDIALNIETFAYGGIIHEGFDEVWDRMILCDLFGPDARSCDLTFSYLNVYTKAPLVCFDVETWTLFRRLEGFHSFNVWISDADFGLGWLTLDELKITFTVDSKVVSFDFGLRIAETVCIISGVISGVRPSFLEFQLIGRWDQPWSGPGSQRVKPAAWTSLRCPPPAAWPPAGPNYWSMHLQTLGIATSHRDGDRDLPGVRLS